MNDLEQPLVDELERLAPAAGIPPRDWSQVRRRARRRPAPRRLAVAAALAAVAVVAPTLAFSASARRLVGLEGPPSPVYAKARLAVSAPAPGGRVARVWVAPSASGGECAFVTLDPAGSGARPTQMTRGGVCTAAGERFRGRLEWAVSDGDPPIIDGRVGPAAGAARVELRWHGGARRLAYRNDFFVAAVPSLASPPFRRLPFDVVALDAAGTVVARSRIPTSFLYAPNWKQVEPKLHRYRVAHGCDRVVVWRCRSR